MAILNRWIVFPEEIGGVGGGGNLRHIQIERERAKGAGLRIKCQEVIPDMQTLIIGFILDKYSASVSVIVTSINTLPCEEPFCNIRCFVYISLSCMDC